MHLNCDVVCVGGGVVGLTIAYELAGRGASVAVVDRGPFGAESSWAGAGILPPASPLHRRTPYDRLRAESGIRYASLAEELLASTDIDVGLRSTGGLYIPLDKDADGLAAALAAEGIEVSRPSPKEIEQLEPSILAAGLDVLWLPGVGQVRNPRLVKALAAACASRSAVMIGDAAVVEILRDRDSVRGVRLSDGRAVHAKFVVVSAGAWSAGLLADLGVRLPVKPIRGQIVLYRSPERIVRHVIECGKEYLVPRDDGLILVGSTEEDAGFDKSNTAEGIGRLRQFAESLYPLLSKAVVERTWAGLRPATDLGSPIIGPAPTIANLWLATGHFRNGVQLAPGTAILIADWLTGRESFATPEDFALDADRSGFTTSVLS